MTELGTPRRGPETDPVRAFAQRLKRIESQLAALSKAATLRGASVTDGRVDLVDSAIVAYTADGAEMARFGLLVHSNPGGYGLEVLTDGEWFHVRDDSEVLATLVDDVATLSGQVATFTAGQTAQDTLIEALTARVDALEGTP